MTIDQQMDLLRRGTADIISEEELAEKLKKGRPLRVKLGVDPTAKDVTLGWAVVLRKLRDFQNLGHQAVLIIGSFTAQIGDPSGKSKTRPQLTSEDVDANIEHLLGQFSKILDIEKTEIVKNGDWLGTMSFADVIRLASRTTVARIIEREDFSNRLKDQQPIALHELMYPLCQAMDSVEIKADVELGGSDQRFNNLLGRTLQQQFDQEPQSVVLCPLLVGTDGTEKMSQSLGNYISIVDEPKEMFGKTMSIPDVQIKPWFELATDVPMNEVEEMLAEGKNPRDAKMRLAREIIALYHSVQEATAAQEGFIAQFAKGDLPEDIEEAAIPGELIEEGQVMIAPLMKELGMAQSNGAAKKLIQQNAVSLDGKKFTDPLGKASVDDLRGAVLKVGKRQYRKLA